jgi:PAS domain S-box-containing protein
LIQSMTDSKRTREQLLEELLAVAHQIAVLDQGQGPAGRPVSGQAPSAAATEELCLAMPAGLWLFEYHAPVSLALVYGNPHSQRLTGVDPEKSRGTELAELWAGDSGDHIRKTALRAVKLGLPPITVVSEYGTAQERRILKVGVFSLPARNVGLVFDDVTSNQNALTELKKIESRYRMLVDKSPVGIVSCDAHGNAVEFNFKMRQTLGLPSATAHKTVNVLTFAPLTESGVSGAIRQCLESGKFITGEFPYKGKWGKQIHLRVSVGPIWSAEGQITGAQFFAEDISDLKWAESLLVRSERLKAVGEMAGNAANTFNNLLQIVGDAAQTAQACLESGNFTQIKPVIDEILEGARQASQTVKRLQHFARSRSGESLAGGELFDLSEAVREGVETCKLSAALPGPEKQRPGVELELDLASNCFVQGVRDEIIEAVVNFVKNAQESMPNGGEIGVRTYCEENHAALIIRDEGTGIAHDHLGLVYEPFWTTKPDRAGMGLAVNLGIIRRHGGTISITSKERAGTSVVVRFPLRSGPERKAGPPSSDHSIRGLRILLIDDNQPLLRVMSQGLEKMGHSALTASSGRQGIDVFRSEQVDAIICDLAMEDVNGWEVSETIRAGCFERKIPKPPFILLTGWAGQIHADDRVRRFGVDRVVEKPAEIPALLDIIMEEYTKAGRKS